MCHMTREIEPTQSIHRVRSQPSARMTVGLRSTCYAVLGMVLSRSAVLAGWQCRQGVELGLLQGDIGRSGVGGDLLCSFRADNRRGVGDGPRDVRAVNGAS